MKGQGWKGDACNKAQLQLQLGSCCTQELPELILAPVVFTPELLWFALPLCNKAQLGSFCMPMHVCEHLPVQYLCPWHHSVLSEPHLEEAGHVLRSAAQPLQGLSIAHPLSPTLCSLPFVQVLPVATRARDG